MISEELQKKIDVLPKNVSEYLGSAEMVDVVSGLRNRFGLTQEQVVALNDIIYDAFVKDIALEDVFPYVRQKMNLDEPIAKELTLSVLKDITYSVRDYFMGLDDEIIKLGGEIPRDKANMFAKQFMKREAEIEEMERQKEEEERKQMADAIINGDIDNLMSQYPQLGDMIIGAQSSISVKGLPIEMKPMIRYWIQDYREKVGYYDHNNLDRVQYVCHDKNTRNMNEEERRQLNLVLKSADGEIELPYSTKRNKIDFSLVQDE